MASFVCPTSLILQSIMVGSSSLWASLTIFAAFGSPMGSTAWRLSFIAQIYGAVSRRIWRQRVRSCLGSSLVRSKARTMLDLFFLAASAIQVLYCCIGDHYLLGS